MIQHKAPNIKYALVVNRLHISPGTTLITTWKKQRQKAHYKGNKHFIWDSQILLFAQSLQNLNIKAQTCFNWFSFQSIEELCQKNVQVFSILNHYFLWTITFLWQFLSQYTFSLEWPQKSPDNQPFLAQLNRSLCGRSEWSDNWPVQAFQ